MTLAYIVNRNMHITPAYKNLISFFLFWEKFDK